MQPPFQKHPLIKEFNELKRYFRNHETSATRERVKDFRGFAWEISKAVGPVAFDFLGSLNFGQATHISDVDMIVYLRCDDGYGGECLSPHCPVMNRVHSLLLKCMMEKYTRLPCEIDMVDCINLNLLERELNGDVRDTQVLLRFAFYRSVGRSVNAGLIRPFQKRLEENQDLLEEMYPDIQFIIESLVHSSRHNWSFKKYQQRIESEGVEIPPPIMQRIRAHLERRNHFQGEGI